MTNFIWKRNISFILLFPLLLILSLLTGCFDQSQDTPEPISDPPTTGLEDRDGDGWTTYDEELAFLDEVKEKSKRVTYSKIGASVGGDRCI